MSKLYLNNCGDKVVVVRADSKEAAQKVTGFKGTFAEIDIKGKEGLVCEIFTNIYGNKFEHNCEGCKFIGHYYGCDVYICSESIISRFGNMEAGVLNM